VLLLVQLLDLRSHHIAIHTITINHIISMVVDTIMVDITEAVTITTVDTDIDLDTIITMDTDIIMVADIEHG